jgi:hypothetical protein
LLLPALLLARIAVRCASAVPPAFRVVEEEDTGRDVVVWTRSLVLGVDVGAGGVGAMEVERVDLTRWNIFESTFSGGSSDWDGGSWRASKLVSALIVLTCCGLFVLFWLV